MAEDTDNDGLLDYYFYHNDHLGTPQKMTASNGAVVWSATYSSFGEAHVNPESTVENNLRLPGQYFDSETGLHYNFHRYFDPSLGKFFRIDPLRLNGGINLFVYSQNSPINGFDAYGLKCIITYSDPFPSGEPLREWEEVTYDGKLKAIILYASIEFWVDKKIPFPIPIPPEWFTYREIHQIVAEYKLYRNYFETCYDDCTKEKISGPKFIFKGQDGGTQEAILDEWTVERTL
jgi:RHS repeat-associated protein